MKQTLMLKRDFAYILHLINQDEMTDTRCVRKDGCYKLTGNCGDCEFLSTKVRRQDTKKFLEKEFHEHCATNRP